MATDVPRKVGGQDEAPQPVQLLLGALIGCKQATATFVAMKQRIKIRSMKFDIEAYRDEVGALSLPIDRDPPVPSRLQKVFGTIVVDTDATQDQIDALARQVHHRCPVANMMHLSGCEMDIQWVKKPPGSEEK